MKDKHERNSDGQGGGGGAAGARASIPPHRGFLCKVQLEGDGNTSGDTTGTGGGASLHSNSMIYVITIQAEEIRNGFDTSAGGFISTRNHELYFKLHHYTFMEQIFAILDTESKGTVNKPVVQEFVMLRCPVFKRRDADLLQYQNNHDHRSHSHHINGDGNANADAMEDDHAGYFYNSCLDDNETFRNPKSLSTFEEVWNATFSCACNHGGSERTHPGADSVIGIEAWMVFCQFISLAQYHDAKRRFSGRHLQTLQKKYGGNGSGSVIVEGEDQELEQEQEQELIIVDLPPLEKPVPLNARSLLEYSHATKDDGGIPLPELDLDHSYISLHDESKRLQMQQSSELKTMTGHYYHHQQSKSSQSKPLVQVSVFGNESDMKKSHASPQPPGQLEFIIQYIPTPCEQDGSSCMSTNDEGTIIVRRSFEDMEWLHKTFKSHKQLGGTLCGRILPPFPSRLDSASGGRYDEDDYASYGYGAISSSLGSIANTSKKTSVAVASAGVGMVSSAAKTAKSFIWGKSSKSKSYPISSVVKKAAKLSGMTPSSSATKSSAMTKTNATDTNHSFDIKAQYSKRYSYAKKSSNTPSCKARQLERYLNYMLEHPALSTSFPLNLILKASQSGLDAAKNILDNQSHNDQLSSSNLHDESSNGIGDVFNSYSSLLKYLPTPSQTMNLKWVRTAAQAALVLRVHGLLETAGYESTSTKLQHASLPQFASTKARGSGDSNGSMDDGKDSKDGEGGDSCSFNDDDDECDGFDVLPEPLPLSERSALCAVRTISRHEESMHGKTQSRSGATSHAGHCRGDLYGMHNNSTSLGDIDVERDTGRLRDLLRQVDKSFSLCCVAMSIIGENRHARAQLQMNILRSIDSWEGMRGKILAQRPLLNGVNSLENTSRQTDDCYVAFSEDMLWNASLATAAVTASDEVCDAVSAAKTASRAKKTADTAVYNLTQLEKEGNERPEDKKNLQERGSKLRMQALHAAVLEHEAESAKKRSVVSLANDVKYWNSHRKRELLHACTKLVRAQKIASEQNLNAWKELKDGLLESHHIVPSKVIVPDKRSTINNTQADRHPDDQDPCLHDFTLESYQSEEQFYQLAHPQHGVTSVESLREECYNVSMPTQQSQQSEDRFFHLEHPQEDLTRLDSLHDESNSDNIPPIQKSQQKEEQFYQLAHPQEHSMKADGLHDDGNSVHISHTVNCGMSPNEEVRGIVSDAQQDYFTPTPSENDDTLFGDQNHSVSDYADAHDSAENFEYTDKHSATGKGTGTTLAPNISSEYLVPVLCDDDINEASGKNVETNDDNNDGMSDSMQSLVDGLLQWGGNWEDDDMNINLPQGMAASLVMENRGVLDLQ